MLAVKVPVIESERGWGAKIDDYMICLSMNDAKEFIKEFNSENTSPTAPDWYMQAEDNIAPIDLTDGQYNQVSKSKNRREWLNNLRKIK